ncbi:hypothetical protein G6F60_001525 [Rhizopus arrhizus]|nr:hypothetical protein G6F60_001525 [Rhizopus arrhizus]
MDTLQVNDASAAKRRLHSNTVSGVRPPALDLSLARPANIRRNSEGSPRIPPVEIMEPTPVETSFDQKDEFLKEDNSRPSSGNSQVHTVDSSFKAEPKTAVNNSSALSLLESGSKKKSRSRASSLTSSLINEIKENPTIQKVSSTLAQKIKHPQSSENSNTDKSSIDGNHSNTAPSSTSTYDLANVKRNQDFHALFRSVPEDDSLIEDYGCALQKEILLQGRIYVSENHLCFNANIFGWITNLVIAFADITNIEKKATAYFIPNAIQISTDNAKYFFASFLSRDQAYDLIVEIWHNCRPDLFPPKECSIHSPSDDELSDEEDNDSDYDTEEGSSEEEADDKQVAVNGTIRDIKTSEKSNQRDVVETPQPTVQSNKVNEKSQKGIENGQKRSDGEVFTQKHEKTNCKCENHYPNVVLDTTYNGTIEKIYKLLFHDEFLETFLIDNQKSTDFTMGEWKKGEGDVKSTRELSYIKPLNNSLGPKSTKCYLTQEVIHEDFDEYVTVMNTTNTPDVPSGSTFSCKTRTCFTWVGKQKVRVLVSVAVEFTKSSWLKSTIEKASIDGQQTYYKDLDAALHVYFKEHQSEFGGSGDEKKKKRKHRGRRTHKSNVQENKENPTQPISHNSMQSLLNRFIDNVQSANLSHFALLCLILMVIINIFIARKMSFIEQQLGELCQLIPAQKSTQFIKQPNTSEKRIYDTKEEKALWELLNRLDPDDASLKKVSRHTTEKLEGKEDVWDEDLYLSKSTKDRLDKHINELSNMIQEAGNNLKDVTKSIHLQRQKLNEE